MKSKGFTLIELFSVVVIIGLLTTVVVVGYSKNLKKSRCTRLMEDFHSIAQAAGLYREARGSWASDVNPLTRKPAFIPDYLSAWPEATYFGVDYYLDWENWPKYPNTTPPGVIPPGNYEYMQAITLRQQPPSSGPSPSNPGSPYNYDRVKYYYCVQDENPSPNSHHDCKTQGFFNPRVSLPTALNRGGSCP